jgi:hypothetical protein
MMVSFDKTDILKEKISPPRGIGTNLNDFGWMIVRFFSYPIGLLIK